MIVSHKNKFVFVHNPKVAGSSLRAALAPYHDHAYEFWQHKFCPALDRVADLAHLTLSEIQLLFPQLSGYTFFCIVRNPEHRLLSSICEYKKQHSGKESIDPFFLDSLTATSIRFDWKYIHFCPQHYYFNTVKTRSPYFKNLKYFFVEDIDTEAVPFIEELVRKPLDVASLDTCINKAESLLKEEVVQSIDKTSFKNALIRLYLPDIFLLENRYFNNVADTDYQSLQTAQDSAYEAITRKCSPFEYFDSEISGVYETDYLKEHQQLNKIWYSEITKL